mmetsp:Transcript_69055/g.218401  ORF Transcript_69055/g.218401 Transcript_69055/m.218401 type:complete len:93 (-) Transcript_69055:806-1084(-)
MNCEVTNVPLLDVENHQIREVLRSILHTILFSRALGLVQPKDVDSELFNLTYVRAQARSICLQGRPPFPQTFMLLSGPARRFSAGKRTWRGR